MSSADPIYLDYNGTTPMHPQVREYMIQTLQAGISPSNPFISKEFGNASTTYTYGIDAKLALNNARKQVAQLLNCKQSEIIFTSGGTESNNMAIQGVVLHALTEGHIAEPHVVTTSFEHPSVENVLGLCKRLYNTRVTELPVDKYGFLDLLELERSLTETTCLVTVMLANNEIGTINGMRQIYEIIQRYNTNHNANIRLHMDCSQAAGKVSIDSQYCDLITVAGHKMYAPKGIGALYVRSGCHLYKIMQGGDQEGGLRPGTENVLLAGALGIACEISQKELTKRVAEHSKMIEALYSEIATLHHRVNGYSGYLLQEKGFAAHFTSEKEHRCLPNTLSVSFPGIQSGSLIAQLGNHVCVAAGAACHSDDITVSPTLQAIGIPDNDAAGTIRITVGDGLQLEDCVRAGQIIREAVQQYQGDLPTHNDSPNGITPTVPHQHIQLRVGPNTAASHGAVQGAQGGKAHALLTMTQGLGCACKVRPQLLSRILRQLDFGTDARLVVATETNDDAAVYQLGDHYTVLTTDFFAPIVDDAYYYGKIAATNALSDIYAMNGSPHIALSIAGFNSARMSEDMMRQIMQGAVDKCKEAGVVIAGGHTIESVEPFFGLCCMGSISNPSKLKKNYIPQLHPHEQTYLILTKKLGAGMLTVALKKGILQKMPFYATAYQDLMENMETLNDTIQRNLTDAQQERVVAMTDVTGFGLIGHLTEMLQPQGLSAEVYARSLRLINGLEELFDGFGGQLGVTNNNIVYAEDYGYAVQCAKGFQRAVVADPNTSGGLLIAVQGHNDAATIANLVNGCIVARVYKNTQQKEICVMDEVFRPFEQRYGGYFRE